MQAYKISDIKDFMNKLLINETFDAFSFVEAVITSFCTFSIEGKLNPDFFDTSVQNTLKEKQITYAAWKEIRPHCYSMIKGKRTPVSFKIVLALPAPNVKQLLSGSHIPLSPEMVTGLFLNLHYRNNELYCTTGISLKSFLPDKSLERLWDTMIPDFFHKHGIPFETI